MSGRNREPSTTLPSGSASDRSNIFSSPEVGNIFYNTDTSNVEIYHQDPSNNAAWRDLLMNNRIETISGEKTFTNTLYATQPRLTGTVIQTVYNNYRNSMTFANKSDWTDTNIEVDITPKSSNSKILITCRLHYGGGSNDAMRWWGARLYRGTSVLTNARNEDSSTSGCWFQQCAGFTNNSSYNYCYGAGNSYLDTANTTSNINYSVYIKPVIVGGTGTFYINRAGFGTSSRPRMTSFIMAQEIYYS